ncbi:MAG: DNA cytosine methyltransferase [Blastocatellia bacterium]|nr:DNA cytosine methyltransferase [Blastocatellia bacterium]
MEVWSLFSGAMGLDLGLEAAGLKPSLAVEIDKWCCETIRFNMPDLDLIQGDVRKLRGVDLRNHRDFFGDVFLMAGGPPCQSFSPGGKRAALADPRGNLIYEYFRLIAEVQPKYFIFENVANLATAALRHRKIEDRPGKHWNLKKYNSKQLSTDGSPPLAPDELSGSALRQLLKDVDSLGYSVVFGVLDAADYGIAQHRLRFVMLGEREGIPPSLPLPTHGKTVSGRKPFRTLRDVIGDLRFNPGPHSSYTPRMAEYFTYVPEGGTWRDLPESLQAEAMGGSYNSGGGKTGFFRRLSWDAPAPTITGRANRKGSAICHPEFTRPLSVKECARIQGFPDEWIFSGPMNQQYLQIGNAVPIELGKAIGMSVASASTTSDSVPLKAGYSMEKMFVESVTRLRASARNKQARDDPQESLFEK